MRREEIEQAGQADELSRLKRTSVAEFWADFNRDPGRTAHATAVSFRASAIAGTEAAIQRSKADQADLAALIKELSAPKNVKSRGVTYRVWESLWQAETGKAVVEACGRWNKLPKRYRDDLVSECVAEHCKAFVAMKEDARFPRSRWADDARIAYLAKGTAGLLLGISPLTAIERLRKITHRPGHPLFHEAKLPLGFEEMRADKKPEVDLIDRREPTGEKAMCVCWRCVVERRRARGALPY